MKVKVEELRPIEEALAELMSTRMPVPAGRALALVRVAVKRAIEPVEEQRIALVKQHGDETDIKAGDPGWNEFLKDYGELMEQEADLDADEGIVTMYQNGDGFFWAKDGTKPVPDLRGDTTFWLNRFIKVERVNGNAPDPDGNRATRRRTKKK